MLRNYRIILLFSSTKLILHLVTATTYGFQRDAYLYLAQAQHPEWGYFSTPPLLAFILRIHTFIWGDSVLAVLLQPVIFNHLFWLLAAVIILLRGKFYYTIAAYTMLVVFGGVAWERWVRRSHRAVGVAVLGFIVLTSIIALPFSLTVFKPARMAEYGRKQLKGPMDVMLKWEDGQVHELPQDYADMVGWDEVGRMVWDFYETLPDPIRNNTLVYGENYGMAGAMLYHRPGPSYPEVYSFSDAFMQWVPRYPEAEHFIYAGYSDRLPLYFRELELVGRVDHPWFRESGLPVWFGSGPTPKLHEDWQEAWQENTGRITRSASPP